MLGGCRRQFYPFEATGSTRALPSAVRGEAHEVKYLQDEAHGGMASWSFAGVCDILRRCEEFIARLPSAGISGHIHRKTLQ